MTTLTNEERFKKWTQVALMAGTALVIGPLCFFLALSLMGISAAIIAAALALLIAGFVQASVPAASQWLTNWKFKALNAVVSRAPIETLYSEQEESYRDLQEANLKLTEQTTEVEVMRDKVDKFKRERADDPASVQRWMERLNEWEKVLAFNIELFKKAKVEYVNFGRIIEDAEMEWDMAATDRKLAKAFGKKDDFMRNLRTKTALESVQRESAAARARLKMSLVNNDYAVSQTKDQDAVHAISYDRSGKIVLGDVLQVPKIGVRRDDQHSE